MVGVNRRQAEWIRVLREREGLGALGGGAVHLGNREIDVPQRQDDQRDVPVRGCGAPFVEHEIVECRHARQRRVAVLPLQEDGSREPGEGGKAQRRFDSVEVHVGQPLHRVVAAGQHLIEARRVDAVILGLLSRHGVETDLGVGLALVLPHLAGRTPLGSRYLDDAGPQLLKFGRQAVGPHPRVLDQVVVDGDQLHMILQRHRPLLFTNVAGSEFS